MHVVAHQIWKRSDLSPEVSLRIAELLDLFGLFLIMVSLILCL
jgi:hypothetical protein